MRIGLNLLTGLAIGFFGLHGQSVAQNSPWQGDWVSDQGLVSLDVDGRRVTGTYGGDGTLTGTATDSDLKLKYKKGNGSGTLDVTLSDDGGSFEGNWKSRGGGGSWNGWKVDPDAEDAETADFSGVWLSSWGTLQLTQDGDAVEGDYGAEGWNSLSGTVTGRRLHLTWKRIQWSGEAWLEQSADGKRIYGITTDDDPTVWTGLRLEGFEHHVTPVAGEVVKGRADNGMLYNLRMPDDWKSGEPVDVIVLLHGSNWTTAGMVPVTARNWPEIGKNFAILGIQGQNWAKWSDMDDLRFNYTYVNWTGRSTYEGYPYTDRESPYLVMNAIDELDEKYSFERVFVGGHSQGGFLTYVLHMHYPEKLDGTFPIAGGLIFQAEPDAFDDENLIAAQKETPMAMVHGQNDQVVRYSTSVYINNRFLGHGFSNLKFINPKGGHPYDFLPINEAIEYLDMMTTTDADALADYAKEQVKLKDWRVVGAAIRRAMAIDGGKQFSPIWKAFETAAKKDAAKHTRAVTDNLGGRWIDDFLEWSDQFGTSKAAEDAMTAFQELQAEHDSSSSTLMSEARKLFNNGDRAGGYKKYQEIADRYFASTDYRTVRESLKNRKKDR